MKLYKATTSFAGKVCMAVNEERRLADKDAAGLLKAGYIKPVEAEQHEEQQSGSDDAESVGETAENVAEATETVLKQRKTLLKLQNSQKAKRNNARCRL